MTILKLTQAARKRENDIMKVLCKLNKLPYKIDGTPENFDFGIKIGKTYLVMAMCSFGNNIEYYIDEYGIPLFCPIELFEIVDGRLYSEWYFKTFPERKDDGPHTKALWGYYELCFNETHYEDLVEKYEDALLLYFKRKNEMEKYFEDLEYLK